MYGKIVFRAMLLAMSCAVLWAAISSLGHPQREQKPYAATVFAGQKPGRLTEDNLVDGLSVLPLPLPLAKVDLNAGILSVDLKVTDEESSTEQVYQGMAELISFAFEHTSNVDQLLLRVLAEDRWLGTRYLLIAADVRRDEISTEELFGLRDMGNGPLPEDLQSSMHITETQLWKSRFLNQ
ncbi:hypothetical protein [Paenibacillus sanguinis]|uniref:hypothetical protein n=1 Tax=Paenibacillus sanguinis TaxID=225906 RepID=UPI00037EEE81|nr:hypothetical protein [Paenibacillus sanguinis]